MLSADRLTSPIQVSNLRSSNQTLYPLRSWGLFLDHTHTIRVPVLIRTVIESTAKTWLNIWTDAEAQILLLGWNIIESNPSQHLSLADMRFRSFLPGLARSVFVFRWQRLEKKKQTTYPKHPRRGKVLSVQSHFYSCWLLFGPAGFEYFCPPFFFSFLHQDS